MRGVLRCAGQERSGVEVCSVHAAEFSPDKLRHVFLHQHEFDPQHILWRLQALELPVTNATEFQQMAQLEHCLFRTTRLLLLFGTSRPGMSHASTSASGMPKPALLYSSLPFRTESAAAIVLTRKPPGT